MRYKSFNCDWDKMTDELKAKQKFLSVENRVTNFLKEMNNGVDELILNSIKEGFNFIAITKPTLDKRGSNYYANITYIPLKDEEVANYYQSKGCEILDLRIIKQAFNLEGGDNK